MDNQEELLEFPYVDSVFEPQLFDFIVDFLGISSVFVVDFVDSAFKILHFPVPYSRLGLVLEFQNVVLIAGFENFKSIVVSGPKVLFLISVPLSYEYHFSESACESQLRGLRGLSRRRTRNARDFGSGSRNLPKV